MSKPVVSRLRSKKLWAVVVIVTAVVLLPYLWSRICSDRNRIRLFEGVVEPDQIASGSIRVACYNIAHGRGLAESNWAGGDANTRHDRLDQIAKLLIDVNADVVVLNEVDFDASWSNHVNQAEYLARKADFPFRVEERNLDFRILHRTWRFGNAILSKYPISNATVIDLPSYAGVETLLAGKKRGVQCDVMVEGNAFRIFGLHLSHRSETVREQSASTVVELIRESPHPCVVMGDMNSTPPGFPYSSQTATGKNAIQTFDESGLLRRRDSNLPLADDAMTYPSHKPKQIIDWILISSSLDFEDYSVWPSRLSDHRPVVADVFYK